jgi:pyridoxamine 5'-phosphate oxidase
MINLQHTSIALLRRDYSRASLLESEVEQDPIQQFAHWFGEARRAQLPEPNAMSVSTVDASGRPSSRILLIKEFDQRGFTWFTNYESRKGQELLQQPYAALLFYWPELERQVRIEGRVERVAEDESDRYFQSRPLNSRLGAIASRQSEPIDSRAELDGRFAATQAQYADQPPRPAHWGGYRLVPDLLEFWQGRASRMHDRIVYRCQPDGSWTISRLQP